MRLPNTARTYTLSSFTARARSGLLIISNIGSAVRYSSRTHSRAPLLSRASTMVVGISLSFTGIT